MTDEYIIKKCSKLDYTRWGKVYDFSKRIANSELSHKIKSLSNTMYRMEEYQNNRDVDREEIYD